MSPSVPGSGALSDEVVGTPRPSNEKQRPALDRLRESLAHDLPASLVVFLVAVPLSMGIALASGAPIFAGLLSAAIGGIIVGILAGAPLQVSGPAAGLAVLVFELIQRHGFRAVCAMTAVAGLIQVALGGLRVARLALAISPAVIHGMLAGIGVLITLAQLHIVLGGAPESSALANLRALPGQLADAHGAATMLGALTIALLVAWPLVARGRLRALHRIPAALVAVVVATAVSVAMRMEVPRVKLPDGLLGALQLPALPTSGVLVLLGAAVTIALVASAESLLCAVATDKLHGGPRASLDRELAAQGVGNLVAGLCGGLPITGVIVRSTANVEAGARTRGSAVLHGVWVVLFVTLLGGLVSRIPLAVLAGLLVFVGIKLVDLNHLRALLRHRQGLVYFTTLLGVVGLDLLRGIGLGVLVAVVELLVRLTRVTITLDRVGERFRVAVRGALTFVAVPKLSARLSEIPPGVPVDVDLDTDVVDHAGFEALHAFRLSHERTGGRVDIDMSHELSDRNDGALRGGAARQGAAAPGGV